MTQRCSTGGSTMFREQRPPATSSPERSARAFAENVSFIGGLRIRAVLTVVLYPNTSGGPRWGRRSGPRERCPRGRHLTRAAIEVSSRQYRSGPTRHRQIVLDDGSFE